MPPTKVALVNFGNLLDYQENRRTGIDNTTAARICYKKIMIAFFTHNPCHTVLWNVTLQKGVNFLHNVCSLVAVLLLKLIRIIPQAPAHFGFVKSALLSL